MIRFEKKKYKNQASTYMYIIKVDLHIVVTHWVGISSPQMGFTSGILKSN